MPKKTQPNIYLCLVSDTPQTSFFVPISLTVGVVAGREGAEEVDREGVHDLRVDRLRHHSPAQKIGT